MNSYFVFGDLSSKGFLKRLTLASTGRLDGRSIIQSPEKSRMAENKLR